jgi:hypothetical protein
MRLVHLVSTGTTFGVAQDGSHQLTVYGTTVRIRVEPDGTVYLHRGTRTRDFALEPEELKQVEALIEAGKLLAVLTLLEGST